MGGAQRLRGARRGTDVGAEVVGLDIDRLAALLPEAEPTGTRHIGLADVETIEQATATYARQDFAQGSGMIRDTALAQLRTTLPLLGAQASPEVRPRLYLAAEDPQGSDLTVFLLNDLAAQAVHLGRPDEALRLVHLGYAAAGPGEALSPRPPVAAWRASKLKPTPPEVRHQPASARWATPKTTSLPSTRRAPRGGSRMSVTLGCRSTRVSPGAHAIAGDIDTAVTVGRQAVDAVSAVHSPPVR